jgi:hypothetical protein
MDIAQDGFTTLVMQSAGKRRHAERPEYTMTVLAGGLLHETGQLRQSVVGTVLCALANAEHGLTDHHRGSLLCGHCPTSVPRAHHA